MRQESDILFLADEGKTFRRKSDNFNMGNGICICETDSIDNYIEDDMTEEELAKVEKEKQESQKKYTIKLSKKELLN